MSSKIVISGWAAVFEKDNQITDPNVSKNLDGLVYDDEFFTDYIGGTQIEDSLAAALTRSGHLVFRYIEKSDYLAVSTVFRANRTLTDEELRFLVNDTEGQWSDGVGENFQCLSEELCGYTIQCLGSSEFPETEYPKVDIFND